ncbi:MAG: alpha/beta fold hydrolase, partial [Catalinimonas sp.]
MNLVRSVVLWGVLWSLATGCVQMRIKDDALADKYRAQDVPVVTHYVASGEGRVRYAVAGDTARGPTVLFVHGAPGDLDEFTPYLTHGPLLADARLISLDRPGYGFSDYGDPAPDFDAQVAALEAVVARERPGRLVLVGHSYG